MKCGIGTIRQLKHQARGNRLSMKTEAPKSVGEYLAALKGDARKTLLALRKTIKNAAPHATEGISYQIPTFFLKGGLVAYAAFKSHCSFFPMSSSLIRKFKKDLEGIETSKGTIRFPVDKPLRASLVKKIVKARVKQNEMRLRMKEQRLSK